MDFQQAQTQFQQLEALRQNGQVDLAQYRTALESLQVVDERGVIWRMQEITGAWYFFWEGQWIPYTPPPQPAQGSPESAPQGYAGHAATQKRQARVPLMIGLLLTLVVVVGGVYLLFTQVLNQPGPVASADSTPTSANLVLPTQPPADFLTLDKLSDATIPADGAPVTDANGVSIQIPPEALMTDSVSGKAVVTTFKMQGQLANALSKNFTIDSPIYTVEAEGQQDSTGRAALVFPAPSPDSRLVKIINDRYLMPVNTQPVDGKLTYYTRMGPADSQDLEANDSLRFDGSMRFVVITPKKASLSEIVPVTAQQQKTPGVNCTVVSEIGVQPCLSNEDRTVKIGWESSLKFTYEEAYKVAKEAEKWMKVYAGKDIGFTNADLSRYWFAMEIVVEAGSGDPQYNPKIGIIYMPLDFAKSIGSGEGSKALLHEIGHWIQDEAYKMCWAGLKTRVGATSNYWWLEVAAENMVMLAKPDAIKDNIASYGAITGSNNALVWQMAINQWPDEFYAQAQLVKVFMCDNAACPLSQKTFVEAINNGTYPYNDPGALTKIGANLEDYARYLIGGRPQKTNTGISLDGVSAGGTFGEVLQVAKKSGQSIYYLGHQGRKPQIDVKNQDGFDSLVINAQLERDGVYPITISSRDGFVGMPVMLTVEGGIPLVYRLDGGEIKTHSGDKPLILGPISANLGYKEVRLAAYSSASGMSFKASLKIIDLAGAWTLQSVAIDKPATNVVICDNPPKEGTDNLYMLLPLYGNIAMAMGDFAPAGSADKLEWTFLPKRLPPDTKSNEFTQNYSMEITPEEITIKGTLDIPKEQSAVPSAGKTAAGLGGLSLGIVGMVGGARLARRWPGRLRKLAVPGTALVVLALLLAGCFDFYGNSDVEIKITKLEASNGNTDATWNIGTQQVPDSVPIWTITQASGTYIIDSTTITTTELLDVKEESYNRCSGTLIFDLKGGVYPDVTISSKE
jgi:hypothetical protein